MLKLSYWVQKNGLWLGPGGFGFIGYSGRGAGRNNPDMQFVPNEGPICCGRYTVSELLGLGGTKFGPNYVSFKPDPKNDMRGRFGFLAHWDVRGSDGIGSAPDVASDGCIIPYDGTHVERIAKIGGFLDVVRDWDQFVLKAQQNGERG